MDRVKRQIAVVIAKCAKKVAEANVNSCCMYVMYQPELPKSVKRLKKR